MHTNTSRSNRILRHATRITVAALALACAFSAPALAARRSHGHDERRPARYDRHVARHDVRAVPRLVVPGRLLPRTRAYYQPWYAGRAWFGPHGHYHAVYRFPVYGPTGIVYAPYAYCGDALVHDPGHGLNGFVAVSGSGFAVTLGF